MNNVITSQKAGTSMRIPSFGSERVNWAEMVKEARLALGMKQLAFAAHLGVSQPAVSRWEKGHDTPPVSIQKFLFDILNETSLVEGYVRNSLLSCFVIDNEFRYIEKSSNFIALYDANGVSRGLQHPGRTASLLFREKIGLVPEGEGQPFFVAREDVYIDSGNFKSTVTVEYTSFFSGNHKRFFGVILNNRAAYRGSLTYEIIFKDEERFTFVDTLK